MGLAAHNLRRKKARAVNTMVADLVVSPTLEDMTDAELRAYAETHDIHIPSSVTRRESIIKRIEAGES